MMSDSAYWRLVDGRSWVRWDDGYAYHCTGTDDVSGHWLGLSCGLSPDTPYDADCDWCWLGAPHTVAAHAARVGV